MLLITGGMGFIGLHTARRFLDAGEDVLVTQFRARREPDFIRDVLGTRLKVEQLDVSDAQAFKGVVSKYDVESIVHLAVPGLGALTPEDEYRTNTQGLINVLEAAKKRGMRRATIASSIAVYGSLEKGPFVETTHVPITSRNATEVFKKAEEILGNYYADQTKLDVAFARLGGIYGPLYHSMANLPSRLTHAAVHGTEPNLSGPGGRSPMAEDTNDLCYVKDAAEGLYLLHTAKSLPHRAYNIGGGTAVRNQEIADAVNAAVPGANVTLPAGKGPGYRENAYMDLTRMTQDTGYKPKYDVRTAIQDYVAWLRNNPQ